MATDEMKIEWVRPYSVSFLSDRFYVRGRIGDLAACVTVPITVAECDVEAAARPILEQEFAAGRTYGMGEEGVTLQIWGSSQTVPHIVRRG